MTPADLIPTERTHALNLANEARKSGEQMVETSAAAERHGLKDGPYVSWENNASRGHRLIRYAEVMDQQREALIALEAREKRLTEALQFYANAGNYKDRHVPRQDSPHWFFKRAEVKEDGGKRAREALEAT